MFANRKLKKSPRSNRPSRRRRLFAQSLEDRRMLAANILVSTEISGQQQMVEYDSSGGLVQQTPIPAGNATAEKARDLLLADDGQVHIFNGTNQPSLSSLDPVSGSWSHLTMPGWSTFSHSSYGGIGRHESFVFVTDMWGGGSAAPKGIVRFDLDTGSSVRFDNWYSYTDLTVGQDGLLYAQSHRTIRVYDPDTLALQRTVQLPFSINGQSQVYRGIAVNDSGDIFAASWKEQVHQFDANGNVQQSITVPEPEPFFGSFTDIDLSSDGELALGTSWGWVVRMSDTFTNVSMFDTGSSSVFVAFGESSSTPAPSVSVGHDFVGEEDGVAVLEVTLSAASASPVSVDYSTRDFFAEAGEDYLATSGTLTFAPGETEKLLPITLIDDIVDEFPELFYVDLSNPVNATIDDGEGFVQISDDDDASFSISDVSVSEGDSGQSTADFVISLSNPSDSTVRVDYATVAQTATEGVDFLGISGRAEFLPGELTKTISVPILGDTTSEANETFEVELSSPFFADIADGIGVGEIVNDDIPEVFVGVGSGDEGVGAQLAFVVTLSAPSFESVTLEYSNLISSGTAVAGQDFVGATGTLTFAPGETQKTILIDLIDDSIAESTEIMHLTIHSAVGASIIGGSQTQWGFIHDDD